MSKGIARFGSDDLVAVYSGDSRVTAYPSVSLYPRLREDVSLRYVQDAVQCVSVRTVADQVVQYAKILGAWRVVAAQPLAGDILTSAGHRCGRRHGVTAFYTDVASAPKSALDLLPEKRATRKVSPRP